LGVSDVAEEQRVEEDFDLLILGAGSTAFAAALTARELGKTAVMVEERPIGGACVNRGCLPSKNLIEAARILHEARNPRFPALAARGVDLDFAALIAQKDDVVHEYRKKKYEALIGGRIAIEAGHVQFVDSHTVEANGRRLTGERVLIATGSRPIIPDIAGLDGVAYLTSDLLTVDEPIELRERPPSLMIVGGGYIALELGQMFSRFGSDVTILERESQLLAHGFDPEVGQSIGDILAAEGVRLVFNAVPISVRRQGTEVTTVARIAGREREYQTARLLVATGRRPNSDGIAVDRAGVHTNDNGEIVVDEFLQTNVAHIFAAGDVIGRQHGSQMATPVGSRQGGIAAKNALSGHSRSGVDHRVVPRTIFTDPEVAVVGMSEGEAIAAGHRCWCSTLPMSLVARAGAIHDRRGIIKMVADADTGEVLGVAIVGRNAGEVVHEAAMAMKFRATVEDFIDLVHVFPSMAEALKIVAISRFKNPAKLSCCAE
jgi:mercuric reductase